MRHPREYGGNRINPIHLKIRVQKRRGKGIRPATPEEISQVLQETSRTGKPPKGWRVYAVNWRHPNSEGAGSALDLVSFRALIRHMQDDIQISSVKRHR